MAEILSDDDHIDGLAAAPPALTSTLTIGRMTATAGEDGRYHFEPTVMPAPSAEPTTECTTCGAIVLGVAEPSEPIAIVTGVHAGRTVVEPINRALVLPVGMALYAHPAPAMPAAAEAMRAAIDLIDEAEGQPLWADYAQRVDEARNILRAQIEKIGGGR
jgi:hypothetical protein